MPEKTKRYCLALDLKNDPVLMEAYKAHHLNVWPEIIKSIRDSGIVGMQIYSCENRLFMIMETEPGFSFDRKASEDLRNPKVQEWERLMNTYQQVLPGTAGGEKWRLMERIFFL